MRENEEERSYKPKVEVLSKEALHLRALREALALLNALRRRFEELAELKPVFREVERLTKAYLDDQTDSSMVKGA